MGRLVPTGAGEVIVVFNPTDIAQQRFNAYGPSELPNKRDEEVGEFVDGLVSGGPAAVADVLSRVSEKARDVFSAYAERMASLAVRRRDRTTLVKAVVALVIGGLDENRRESLMVMAPIEDSAARIGVDFPSVIEDASKVVGHPGTVNLVLWLMRKPEDRSLASMGFVAAEDDDGFRYKLDW
jgi:hypothetical protein